MRVAGTCLVAIGLMGWPGGPDRAEAQAVGFVPTVGFVPDGVGLNVTPVVSPDRRYVRLSVGAGFQTVNGFQTFGVPAAVSGGAGGGLGSIGVISGMNGPTGPAMAGGSAYPGSPFGYGYGFGSQDPGGWTARGAGNWSPSPRRARATRPRAPRSKKPAPAKVVEASEKKP